MRQLLFLAFALSLLPFAGCTVIGSNTCKCPMPTTQTSVTAKQVHRVTTAVPFPRGLQIVNGRLYVLARGRVRESGGADGKIDDQAGSIFVVDPNVGESLAAGDVSQAVRDNGTLFAAPTSPPFELLDRTKSPATEDRKTDRPYCGLQYDVVTQNFYLCAFSGIDKPEPAYGANASYFSKNLGDAVYRYDMRTRNWHVVEKHNIEKGGLYPHHDPQTRAPPHGRLNGPDNCLVVGRWLYAVAKDNSTLARYDLSTIAADPTAPAPPSEWVMDARTTLKGRGETLLHGHSMLAARDGYLYVGYRTSSAIVRFPLAADSTLKQPIEGELVATFDPYDARTGRSANLTDMAFGPDGDLYVISAQPSRVFRFRPNPARVFDGRTPAPAWADLAALTGNPKMKSENLLVDDAGRVFVTSGDAYAYQGGNGGTVYRIDPE